jgi:hypothetical protein
MCHLGAAMQLEHGYRVPWCEVSPTSLDGRGRAGPGGGRTRAMAQAGMSPPQRQARGRDPQIRTVHCAP